MDSKTTYTDPSSSLVNRCKEGEKEAFYELYKLYAKAMFNISIRIVNNKDEAEDILQECFTKVFQQIKDFDGRVTFGSWLKRIVINRSIDVIRKQKINFQSLDNEAENIENEPEEEQQLTYNIETVRNCINELADGYRIVLSLYLLEDYSHKEIAQTLSITEGTSKSQYNRAKKKLVELIKQKSNTI